MMILILLVTIGVTTAASPPDWSRTYTVFGTLSIPFAEIEEPFTAYADLDNGRSRIDYYGGLDKTFQRADVGDYGTMFKVIPITDENVKNEINCFQANGTEESPVEVQSILPSLEGFLPLGEAYYNGKKCQKWQKKEIVGNKYNKYTMWLTTVESHLNPSLSVAIPVHYEMKGYNTLLGSHYDHYFLDYTNFSPETPDISIFDAYQNQATTCRGFPGPGHDHTHTMNPMKEFITNHVDHVDKSFDDFVDKHDKQYAGEHEKENRKDIFRQNLRFIHSNNRKHLSYKLAVNHLADMPDHELRRVRGRLRSTGYNGGLPFTYTAAERRSIPKSLDWRYYGAVTPVKDQSVCGSCWSFGTVGTLEGANFLATGNLIPLSQQALVDCSWGFGNNGCDGGEDFRVYQFMMKHGGIPTADSYGPYLGADGFCHMDDKDVQIGFQIENYVNVTSGSIDALKVAIAKHGPVSVAIDASHKTLSFYSSGVYYDPKCGNTTDDLDHAVLAVGYGELNGEGYWLIKNSWSTYWGNDGYVLMSQKDNNCGVATAATFVNPKSNIKQYLDLVNKNRN